MMTKTEKEIEMHIALGIIQNEKGEVLIIQRVKEEKDTDEINLTWAFPGGEVKEGEDSTSAVVREILEETGYLVSVFDEISERRHPQFPVYIHYMSGKLISLKQVGFDKSEVKEIKWINPKLLGDYFTTDFDEKVQNYLGIN